MFILDEEWLLKLNLKNLQWFDAENNGQMKPFYICRLGSGWPHGTDGHKDQCIFRVAMLDWSTAQIRANIAPKVLAQTTANSLSAMNVHPNTQNTSYTMAPSCSDVTRGLPAPVFSDQSSFYIHANDDHLHVWQSSQE